MVRLCASASGPTDPLRLDTDGDGFTDGAECRVGTDPANRAFAPPRAPAGDTDRDGLADAFESAIGTNPSRPDSDGDTVLDSVEVMFFGSNPLSPATDDDVCTDGKEIASLNDDTKVNSTDHLIIAQSFGPSTGANYVLDFDTNRDTKINSTDMLQVAKAFGPASTTGLLPSP